MNDYVVDSNVWAMVDKPFDTLSKAELLCVIECRKWLKSFIESEDRLVVDLVKQMIIREYRGVIPKGGLAERYLNELERKPRDKRLVEVIIAYDENNCAVLPFDLQDEDDRKFAAVALEHKPTPPIVDASDTDWELSKAVLSAAGLTVIELCPAYIQALIAPKGS